MPWDQHDHQTRLMQQMSFVGWLVESANNCAKRILEAQC
jgi:hypothetical protein